MKLLERLRAAWAVLRGRARAVPNGHALMQVNLPPPHITLNIEIGTRDPVGFTEDLLGQVAESARRAELDRSKLS